MKQYIKTYTLGLQGTEADIQGMVERIENDPTYAQLTELSSEEVETPVNDDEPDPRD